ncbi:MAG TPA: ornithine cyclodeaminase, partial [Oceanithermus sp.]|nr:ornithine cyclodeaminase [Oceanithermus sp.]
MTPSYLELTEALREVLTSGASAPRRQVLPVPGGRFLVMPAADERLALAKLVVVRPGASPSVFAELWAMRLDSGEVFRLPAEELTVRRTAALSLLAARTLAPRREGALLLVGAGRQARGHLEAFHEGLALTRVLIKGRSPERVEALLEAARALG